MVSFVEGHNEFVQQGYSLGSCQVVDRLAWGGLIDLYEPALAYAVVVSVVVRQADQQGRAGAGAVYVRGADQRLYGGRGPPDDGRAGSSSRGLLEAEAGREHDEPCNSPVVPSACG